MKKVTNACVGGRNFTLDNDAYNRLDQYLAHFRSKLTVPESQKAEVMDDIERRIAELFFEEVGDGSRVITEAIVNKVAGTLGMPDGSSEGGYASYAPETGKLPRKLFRDPDDRRIAGICAGLAWYLDVDVTLVRVLMLAAALLGSAGFWVYIILWVAVPKADTPARNCEMRGMPATAENMSQFAGSGRETYNK